MRLRLCSHRITQQLRLPGRFEWSADLPSGRPARAMRGLSAERDQRRGEQRRRGHRQEWHRWDGDPRRERIRRWQQHRVIGAIHRDRVVERRYGQRLIQRCQRGRVLHWGGWDRVVQRGRIEQLRLLLLRRLQGPLLQ